MAKSTFKLLVIVGAVLMVIWLYSKGYFAKLFPKRIVTVPVPASPTPGTVATNVGTNLANQAITSVGQVVSTGLAAGTATATQAITNWLSGTTDQGTIAVDASGNYSDGFVSGEYV